MYEMYMRRTGADENTWTEEAILRVDPVLHEEIEQYAGLQYAQFRVEMIERFEPTALKITRFAALHNERWDGAEDLFTLGSRIVKGVEEVDGDKPKVWRDERAVQLFLMAIGGHKSLVDVLAARKDLKQMRDVYAAVATYNAMSKTPVPLHPADVQHQKDYKNKHVHNIELLGVAEEEGEGDVYNFEQEGAEGEQGDGGQEEEIYFIRAPQQNSSRGNPNSRRGSGRPYRGKIAAGTPNYSGSRGPSVNKCDACGGLRHVREECVVYLRQQRNKLGLCLKCGGKHLTNTCTLQFTSTGPPPETTTTTTTTSTNNGTREKPNAVGTGGVNVLYSNVRLPPEPPDSNRLNVIRELKPGAST
jgi:hypothetical protein